jgi:hypothetical protein
VPDFNFLYQNTIPRLLAVLLSYVVAAFRSVLKAMVKSEFK